MDAPPAPIRPRCSEREIILLLAGMMAMNALAIDTMLPALPMIGESLGVSETNRLQLVVIAYFVGFGSSQMLWGPIADRFGRKATLIAGISFYCLFGFLAAITTSFTLLIAARFAMGASGSVSRVLVLAIVRDLYEGEKMARIMSLTFMVFMVVPVMAPSLGQLLLLVGPWRLIFYALAIYGMILLAWSSLRLPETLHPEYRRDIRVATIASGIAATLRDRLSVGYTLGMTAVFGALIAYLSSITQLLADVFERPDAIGWVFAAIAAPMGIASWGNSRIVERLGLRRVGHAGLLLFVTAMLAHYTWHTAFGSTLVSFTAWMSLALTAFAFTTANFGTLAMTNMAPIAGTASSVQGTLSNIGAALIGFTIGQAYDGTPTPFLAGCALCGLAALAIVLRTERGRLFQRRHCPLTPLPTE